MSHLMIDIETLGMAPRGVILQIGACWFDPASQKVDTPFTVNVDPHQPDREIDASTVEWWMKQDRRTWEAMRRERKTIWVALRMLTAEFNPWRDFTGVWTNAPLFDFAILRDAFQQSSFPVPWNHRQERCSRTLLWLAGQRPGLVLPLRKGTHHHAGDDAYYQAQCVNAMWQHLR